MSYKINMLIADILNSLPQSLDMMAITLRHSENINKVDDLSGCAARFGKQHKRTLAAFYARRRV